MNSSERERSVTLKNGAEENGTFVGAVWRTIEHLIEHNSIAMYELVMLCHNAEHKCFGNAEAILKEAELVDSHGYVHNSIKHIVLSAVKDDPRAKGGMSFRHPIKDE